VSKDGGSSEPQAPESRPVLSESCLAHASADAVSFHDPHRARSPGSGFSECSGSNKPYPIGLIASIFTVKPGCCVTWPALGPGFMLRRDASAEAHDPETSLSLARVPRNSSCNQCLTVLVAEHRLLSLVSNSQLLVLGQPGDPEFILSPRALVSGEVLHLIRRSCCDTIATFCFCTHPPDAVAQRSWSG
jgi:hypothetical protein